MELVSDFAANVREASAFLKLLVHPDRLLIACVLVDGEKSVTEIEDAIGVPQPRLSQQLAALRRGGIIAGTRRAKRVIYRIADRRTARIVAVLHELFCAAPNRVAMPAGSKTGAPRGRKDPN